MRQMAIDTGEKAGCRGPIVVAEEARDALMRWLCSRLFRRFRQDCQFVDQVTNQTYEISVPDDGGHVRIDEAIWRLIEAPRERTRAAV